VTGARLTIRLSRRPDGAVLFELQRADGTRTWQKRTGATADFFAVHDLTHYAVETELGFARAFYGLVAEGWELADFGTPWPRGPLPPDALPAEVIVGCFDTARAAHMPLTAADCNASVASYFGNAGMGAPPPVADEALRRVQDRLSDLVWRWHALPAGEMLELPFPAERS
jgi:hypothetical protein